MATGFLGGLVMLIGEFGYDSEPAKHNGIAVLVSASIWNAWPKKRSGACSACVSAGSGGSEREETKASAEADIMNSKRKVEVFSAGCPVCQEAVDLVKGLACPGCDVPVLDMTHPAVASRAKGLGVRSVLAVAVDGKLADCCSGRGVDEATLRAAGVCIPGA